jgi:hypothetical protein
VALKDCRRVSSAAPVPPQNCSLLTIKSPPPILSHASHKKLDTTFRSRRQLIDFVSSSTAITMATSHPCSASFASDTFVANLANVGVDNCPVSWSEPGGGQLVGSSSYFGGQTPLQTWVGYIIVIGFGLFFSIFTTIVVYLDKKFAGNANMTSEHFK